ncbi:hypothetical protein Taro_003965, partial [Colocasia esculenta]|nr:hypothetical protein [Colocasia esculenta]
MLIGFASLTTPVVLATGSASCPVASPVPSHSALGPVDSLKEFPLSAQDLLFDMFTSLWEARDKEAKIAGIQDPTTWIDYDPVWMRRNYCESFCHRWATGPWQERSQVAKHNRAAHSEENVHTTGSVSYANHSQKLRHELERAPTFCKLFDRTQKRKGTEDCVSKSARTISSLLRRMRVRLLLRRPAVVERTSEPSSGKSCRNNCYCTLAPWSSSWWLPSEEQAHHSKPL